jgi:hypothetical protein
MLIIIAKFLKNIICTNNMQINLLLLSIEKHVSEL